MRKLLALLILTALALAADVVAKERAEAAITARVASSLPEGSAVSVQLRSFPFLARLAVTGEVAAVDVIAQDVPAGPLRFSRVATHLTDVRLDRSQLLDRRIAINGIDEGSVAAIVERRELEALLPGDLTLPPQLTLSQGALLVGAARVDIPLVPLVPCVSDAEIVRASVRFTCRFERLPVALRALASDPRSPAKQ